jgi:hypothetical protein
MYVYYIVMEIYVLGCINIFSPFYCLCINSMPHHSRTMNYTSTTLKPFKIETSIPFTILFYQTLHSYNSLFLSSEGVSKGHKHPLIYYPKGN